MLFILVHQGKDTHIERQGPIHISKDVGMFEACQSNPGSYETAGQEGLEWRHAHEERSDAS